MCKFILSQSNVFEALHCRVLCCVVLCCVVLCCVVLCWVGLGWVGLGCRVASRRVALMCVVRRQCCSFRAAVGGGEGTEGVLHGGGDPQVQDGPGHHLLSHQGRL